MTTMTAIAFEGEPYAERICKIRWASSNDSESAASPYTKNPAGESTKRYFSYARTSSPWHALCRFSFPSDQDLCQRAVQISSWSQGNDDILSLSFDQREDDDGELYGRSIVMFNLPNRAELMGALALRQQWTVSCLKEDERVSSLLRELPHVKEYGFFSSPVARPQIRWTHFDHDAVFWFVDKAPL